MLRVVQQTFYGQKNARIKHHLPDISFGQGLPRMMLAGVLLLFGFFPSLMFDVIQTFTIPFMEGLPQ
jgi:NADH-quinone oxidoreductase subunit M